MSQPTLITINFIKNQTVKLLEGFLQEYQEDTEKIDLKAKKLEKDSDTLGYQVDEEKQLDKSLVDDEYWFSSNINIKNSNDFISNFKKEIRDDPNTKFYYGIMSFTTEMLADIGIERNNLNKRDIEFLKKVVNNTLDVLGKDYFKNDNYNNVSIFHNNRNHLHVHWNLSENQKNQLDKIPLEYIYKMHIKQQSMLVNKSLSDKLGDKDFRNKKLEEDSIYFSLLEKTKSEMKLKNFRYAYLEPKEKIFLDETILKDLKLIYKNEFQKLNDEYDFKIKKHFDYSKNYSDEEKIKIMRGVNQELDKLKNKDIQNFEKIILNRFLKDLKEHDIKINKHPKQKLKLEHYSSAEQVHKNYLKNNLSNKKISNEKFHQEYIKSDVNSYLKKKSNIKTDFNFQKSQPKISLNNDILDRVKLKYMSQIDKENQYMDKTIRR